MTTAPVRPIRHVCAFDAVGVPQPQGSMRAFWRGNKAVVTTDNPQLHYWREIVGWAAREAMAGQPLVQRPYEVYLHLTFRLPRPPSLPKRRVHPTTKPDLDKLLRASFDAMTGVVFTDDSQCVGCRVNKRYAEPGEQPGVSVEVWAGGPAPP